MLQKIFSHKKNLFLIFCLIVSFALLRLYEKSLFYDPFLIYFKGNFSIHPLPEVNQPLLILNYFIRYTINSLISLAILKIIFKDINIIKFASLIYFLFFVVIITLLLFSINFIEHKMILFYIRRFIIQPILLLLFLAGFYYQKQIQKK